MPRGFNFQQGGMGGMGGVDPADIFRQFFGQQGGGMPDGGMPGGFSGWQRKAPGQGPLRGGGPGGMRGFSPGGFSPEEPAVDRPDVLPAGTAVRLQGLVGHADLNGARGTVEGYRANPGGRGPRYTVQLAAGGRLAVRPGSLQQQVAGVALVGLAGSPELNGAHVTVTGYSEEDGRYQAELPDGRPASLPPANLRLPAGTRVKVVGLTKGTQWNEQWGVVAEFDEPGERYLVEVGPGRQLKVRPANLRP